MSVERFEIDFHHQTIVLVDLAECPDANERLDLIAQSLQDAEAIPISRHSFAFPATSALSASEIKDLIETHFRRGDQALVISQGETGLVGSAILWPPENEGIRIG